MTLRMRGTQLGDTRTDPPFSANIFLYRRVVYIPHPRHGVGDHPAVHTDGRFKSRPLIFRHSFFESAICVYRPDRYGHRRRGLNPFLRECGLICWLRGTYAVRSAGSRCVRCQLPQYSHWYTQSSTPRSAKLSSAASCAWARSWYMILCVVAQRFGVK